MCVLKARSNEPANPFFAYRTSSKTFPVLPPLSPISIPFFSARTKDLGWIEDVSGYIRDYLPTFVLRLIDKTGTMTQRVDREHHHLWVIDKQK